MRKYILEHNVLVALAIIFIGVTFFAYQIYAASIVAKFPGSLNVYAEGDVIEEEAWNAIETDLGTHIGAVATGTPESINWIIRNARFATTALMIGTSASTTISSTATSTFQKGIALSGGCFELPGGSCLKTGGDPSIVLVTIGGTSYLRPSTTANTLYLHQGFVSIASSTVAGVLNVSDSISASSSLSVKNIAQFVGGFSSEASSTLSTNVTISGLLKAIGGLNSSSTATSTIAGGISVASVGGVTSASGLTITGGNINFAGDSIADLVGTGLQISGGALTLNATGDWTGTLDSIEGASFLRSDASDSYTSGTLTFDASTIIDASAASLKIPNASSPTVTTLGYLALDTTNNELLMATSTTGGAVVYAKEIKQLYSFVLASTSPAFKNGNSLPLPSKEMGFTAYYIQCNIWGGTSYVINLTDSSNNDTTAVTCDTATSTQRALVTNNVWTAGEGTSLESGTITGTVDYLIVSVWGIWTRR